MKAKKILIYGLQRCGTNYLEAILQAQFKVKIINQNYDRKSPMQKHFRLYNAKNIIPEPQYFNNYQLKSFNEFEKNLQQLADFYIVISKNPYSWYLSYLAWAKKNHWPNVTHHYIEEYNHFYNSWLSFAEQSNKIIFVKYENLLNNKKKTIHRLSTQMNIDRRFLTKFFHFSIKKVRHSTEFTKKREQYYLKRLYLNEFNDELINELNANIDLNVLAQLGYEFVEKV